MLAAALAADLLLAGLHLAIVGAGSGRGQSRTAYRCTVVAVSLAFVALTGTAALTLRGGPPPAGAAPIQAGGPGGVVALVGRNAIKADGTVWTWSASAGASQLYEFSGVAAVGPVIGRSSVALRPDGTVWSEGGNESGQLGDGTTVARRVPVRAKNLSGVTTIASSGRFTLALKSDGTVWAWGENLYGQLGASSSGTCGINNYACSTTPIRVGGLTSPTAISAGGAFSLALKPDGTVWAWGRSDKGQLGTATSQTCFDGLNNPCSRVPLQVTGLTGVTAVTAAYEHSLALKGDGTVWAWGTNMDGELGNPQDTNCSPFQDISGPIWCSSTPLRVNGLSGGVALGQGTSGAITADGTVWMWGGGHLGAGHGPLP